MQVDDNAHNPSISARTRACRLWQDDEDWLLSYCKETGRKPAVVARELFSEAVRLRRAAPPLDSHEREPEITIADVLNRLSGKIQCQEEMLCEHYGLLLELLTAFCEVRNLIWKQLSCEIVKKEANHDQTRSRRA